MPSLKSNGKRLNGKGSSWITPVRRLAIYIRDGFTCAYCGKDLRNADPREVTLDHLRPQTSGGSHAATNLITACGKCNFRRQHRSWKQFIQQNSPELAEALITRIATLKRRRPNTALAKSVLAGEVSRLEVVR